jgi:hypothetical protein
VGLASCITAANTREEFQPWVSILNGGDYSQASGYYADALLLAKSITVTPQLCGIDCGCKTEDCPAPEDFKALDWLYRTNCSALKTGPSTQVRR